jgi:hypothetical protein
LLVVDRVLLHSLRQDLKVRRPSPFAYAKMVGINPSAFSKTALLQADWFSYLFGASSKGEWGDRFGMR